MPELCQDSCVALHENICANDCVKHPVCTYPLNHINYDFYNKGLDVVVQVYVKEIKEDALAITFNEDALTLYFKTSSHEFLKLHTGSSEETLFEWHVNLRYGIASSHSKYKTSKGKVTLTLKKLKGGTWNSFHAFPVEEKSTPDLKDVVNGGPTTHQPRACQSPRLDHCKINGWQRHSNDASEGISEHLSNLNIGVDRNGVKDQHTVSNCNGDIGLETELDAGCVNGNNECSVDNSHENNAEVKKCSNSNKSKATNYVDHNCFNGLCEHDSPSKNHSKSTKPNKDEVVSTDSPTTEVDGVCNGTSDCQISKVTPTPQQSTVSTATPKCDSRNSFVDNRETSEHTGEEFVLRYDEKVHTCRPGSTGLLNHKNMCYVNSVVQCLSSARGIRKYFLNKCYHSDTNRTSKHGFGGDLVTCFGSLVQALWSGEKRCVSASKLKDILGRKNINLNHVGQGDAQEFLTFLLDGLHEDLKNEEKKFIVKEDSECHKNIVQKGRIYWQKFTNGNQSIINELFCGQSLSEIQCRDCKNLSVCFDPWMELNLPIPHEPKDLVFFVFFLDPNVKPLQVKLEVSDGEHCSDILRQLSQLVEVPANNLILMNPSYSRIANLFDETDNLSYGQIKDYLIACEVLQCKDKEDRQSENVQECNGNLEDQDCNTISEIQEEQHNRILHISVIQRCTHRVIGKCSFCSSEKSSLKHCSNCFQVAYCNSECQTKHWKKHRSTCNFLPEVIGVPFIISIPASQVTVDQLKKKALQYARFSVVAKKGKLENLSFRLRLLKNVSDFHSKGQLLTQEVVSDNVCIALDWESATIDRKVQVKQLDCDVHESVEKKHFTQDKTVSLNDCLKLYWKTETIRKETGWRCDYCKDVRAANRKVTIFRHPKNMIIHIKRFSYERNGRKVTKHVSFPLRGLDMSAYTYHEASTGASVYDLHAVCTHQGVMDYGHFFTCAKPYSWQELETLGWTDTDGWLKYNDVYVSCISESQVESAEAYILFYQRRDDDPKINESSLKSDNLVAAEKAKTADNSGECAVSNARISTDALSDGIENRLTDHKGISCTSSNAPKVNEDSTPLCNNISHSQVGGIPLEDDLD